MVLRPAVRRLHHLPDRRRSRRPTARRSTSSRPTPSSSGLHHRVRRRALRRRTTSPSTSTCSSSRGIVTTVFLGGWLLPFGIDPPDWVDPFVVLVKMSFVVFFFIWIRATLPAPALRPADELRLEDPAAAGDAQRPGHRDRGGEHMTDPKWDPEDRRRRRGHPRARSPAAPAAPTARSARRCAA